uniref:TPR_REGION domain-containing protein n=1 Tax=Panagrellus redivivus TaxID=6233 RepID=A0A7E4UUI2_PANRE
MSRQRPPGSSWISFQYVCFLVNAFIFSCICCVPLVLGETHWVLNDIENGRIEPVSNSPLCLRQPHSLVQFIEADELSEKVSQAYVEVGIARKEAFDAKYVDPKSAEKIMETDSNCRASKSIKFEEKTFNTFVEYDLMPALVETKTYITPPLAKDILTPSMLRKLYFGPLTVKKGFEPYCGNVPVKNRVTTLPLIHAGDLFALFPYPKEPYLIDLSKENLIHLGELIASSLDNDETRIFGLYYAGYYWRYHGNAVEAAACFQKSILMSMSSSGVFALASMHYLAGDYHHALAAFSTEDVVFNSAPAVPIQWYQASGDLHALMGELDSSEAQYTEALKTASKAYNSKNLQLKRSLVKCVKAIRETNPEAHSETVLKVKNAVLTLNEYREKVMNIKLPAADHIKAKYAYEHLTHGPMNGMSCQSYFTEGSKPKSRVRTLDCRLTNSKTYNASLAAKKVILRRDQSLKVQELMDVVNKGPAQRAEFLTYVHDAHVAFDEYYKKLTPFVGVDMDEPQSGKKYPLEGKTSTPIIEKVQVGPLVCEGLETFDLQRLYDTEIYDIEPEAFPFFPELIISPDNKGFSPAYLLTTLLALGPFDSSPLPWAEPSCLAYLNVDDNTTIVPGLKIGDYTKTKIPVYHEKTLRHFLETLLGGTTPQEKALVGDIGQRIYLAFQFNIGPKWMLYNLAAAYWRFMGNIKEAAICLKGALAANVHNDIALNQLAQLTVRLGPEYIPAAKKIAEEAIKIDPDEPVSHYTLGFLNFLDSSLYRAKREFTKTLELEPNFEDAKLALISVACLRRSSGTIETVRNLHRPMCCWPSEQNVYCFGRGDKQRCFRLSVRDDSDRVLDYQYVRCSGRYTKESYKVSPIYRFLLPLYVSMDELDNLMLHTKIQNITRGEEKSSKDTSPVIPLDDGGFDTVKFPTFRGIPEMDRFEQSSTDYGEARKKRLQKEAENNQLRNARLSEQEFEEKVRIIQGITDRRHVVSLDVELPAFLPNPGQDMVKNGLKYLKPPQPNTLADYCVMTEKNKRVLDHPSPTYISVTAKGIRLEEYVDPTAPVTSITGNEPICPEPEADDQWNVLDDLPGYQFREHYRFYNPETALTDALMSLGNKHERIDHVAARLHLALKTSKLSNNGNINGVVTAVSSLYWRVKGDPVNALKCLRHALKYLPEDMKDTALISMANIYHQAGFLHSALIVGGKAHQRTPDLVVTHFTLANIYATMGDYQHALQFFYSTLALQPSFQQAKERIRAIYCLTHGKVTV